jgi:ketosteroid isomerase-like protein
VTRAELLQILVGGAAVGAAVPAAAAEREPSGLEARLHQLEARDEIHDLMMAYGRTLDRRDFQGFEGLWAPDAEYVQGRSPAVKGPAAIRALLERAFATNAAGVKDPNFHVFFNETIGPVEGDRATAFSRSAFVAAGADGKLDVVVTAHYDDVFVRANGRWKFQRRVIAADLPAASGPPPGSR